MMDKNTILVVDDDEVFLEVLSTSLRKRGYYVLSATNLKQALALAQNRLADYAVIDLKIEHESGLDVLVPLTKLNPSMRILILTGYSSIVTAVTAIKRGAFDYACKPLDTDEILALLMADKKNAQASDTVDLIDSDPITVKRLQWEHIQRVLEANAGNISATARSLGMHRRTLQRKLQKKPVRR